MNFENQQEQGEMTGSLLIAHPGLQDPNFSQTVVLISAHSADTGTLGIVINRPTGLNLGDHSLDLCLGPLASVPLFVGGPVQVDQLLLAAWQWQPDQGLFRMYFGLSQERAVELLEANAALQLRAFAGYSGWGKGQLESELGMGGWLVTPIADASLQTVPPDQLWPTMIQRLHPEWLLLNDGPDDPSVN